MEGTLTAIVDRSTCEFLLERDTWKAVTEKVSWFTVAMRQSNSQSYYSEVFMRWTQPDYFHPFIYSVKRISNFLHVFHLPFYSEQGSLSYAARSKNTWWKARGRVSAQDVNGMVELRPRRAVQCLCWFMPFACLHPSHISGGGHISVLHSVRLLLIVRELPSSETKYAHSFENG